MAQTYALKDSRALNLLITREFHPELIDPLNAAYTLRHAYDKDERKKFLEQHGGEIEAVLQGHDAVAEAAVVGQRGADNEEAVVAYVTLRRPVAVDELATLCRQRLTAYRVPRDIHVVDSLPRNPAGKVDKLALARGGAAGKSEGSTQ